MIDTGRGGYTVTMRESWGAEHTLQCLESLSREPPDDKADRLHIGWGSFRNLDIIAARKSSSAILCDINVHQFRVWNAVRRAAVQAEDAIGFIELLVPLLPANPPLRQFHDSTRQWLISDMDREGSWLNPAKPERFYHVRQLFERGEIVELPLDMRSGQSDVNRFLSFRQKLENQIETASILADTIYISNVPWMMAQPLGFFGERHSDHLPPGVSALQQCHRNLATICPLFEYVVSAMALSPRSSSTDLQWETECLSPQDFLRSERWNSLAAITERVSEQ